MFGPFIEKKVKGTGVVHGHVAVYVDDACHVDSLHRKVQVHVDVLRGQCGEGWWGLSHTSRKLHPVHDGQT